MNTTSRSELFALSGLVAALAFCAGTGAADTATLNNGSTLEGQVIKDAPYEDELVFSTGAKTVNVKRKDIKELKVDQAAREEFKRRLQAIKAGDAKGHFDLAEWAKGQKLFALAEAELHATIAADPNHEQARKALGHVLKDGRWLAITQLEDSADDSDALTIDVRPNRSNLWQERISYYNRALDVSKLYAVDSGGDEKARSAALAALFTGDKNRATEGLLGCLNSGNTAEPKLRLGALKAIEAAKLTHPVVSTCIAATAIRDPEYDVRRAAVASIKTRKDDAAVGKMIQYLMAAYDEAGNIMNAAQRDDTIAALKDLNDKRVLQTLLYYVTIETRATNTELANFTTRQIDSFTVNNGANTSLVIPLSFPIQFPELKITRVRTTVKCPASSSLEDFTGMNFGMDAEKWAKWLAKQ